MIIKIDSPIVRIGVPVVLLVVHIIGIVVGRVPIVEVIVLDSKVRIVVFAPIRVIRI